MNSKELLQTAETELDRAAQQLVRCESAAAQILATIESLTDKFAAVGQDLSPSDAAELEESLRRVQTKSKRLQALLEAGTEFHCHSIFGRTQTPDTYGTDGTFTANPDSRMIFQG